MKAKLAAHKQQGQVALLTALVLLISLTLITLLTSKTVLVETQITADNYRTSQATAAASAAMDQAVAYFTAGGLNQINNTNPVTAADTKCVDYLDPSLPAPAGCSIPAAFSLTLTAGAQTTTAQFYFNNSPTIPRPANPTTKDIACDCAAGGCVSPTNMTRALVTAIGWSDDNSATRTITQCVGTFDIFNGGKSPQQPFVSKASVGAFGNAKIINRYNNTTIWSGGSFGTPDAAFGTYLRPSGTETADYTIAQLDSEDETANTQLVSNRNAGVGIDVVTGDPTLSSKTADQFFETFFAQTKAEIKNAADNAGQLFPAGTSLDGKAGLIWVNGDTTIGGGALIGSPTNPAIIIVDGDLTLHGATIYGVVYATGVFDFTGNPVIKGSMVAENPAPSTGAGNPTLVYKPWGDDGTNQAPPFITGTGAVIAGSWKDW